MEWNRSCIRVVICSFHHSSIIFFPITEEWNACSFQKCFKNNEFGFYFLFRFFFTLKSYILKVFFYIFELKALKTKINRKTNRSHAKQSHHHKHNNYYTLNITIICLIVKLLQRIPTFFLPLTFILLFCINTQQNRKVTQFLRCNKKHQN